MARALRIITTSIAGLALAGLALVAGLAAHASSTPCPAEDSLNCTWTQHSHGYTYSYTTVSLFSDRLFVQWYNGQDGGQ